MCLLVVVLGADFGEHSCDARLCDRSAVWLDVLPVASDHAEPSEQNGRVRSDEELVRSRDWWCGARWPMIATDGPPTVTWIMLASDDAGRRGLARASLCGID